MQAARDCIQIHGGIGFTWDNDTHLWYRRAKSAEVFLGTPAEHREWMLRRWRMPKQQPAPEPVRKRAPAGDDSAQERQVRQQVRAWLAAN